MVDYLCNIFTFVNDCSFGCFCYCIGSEIMSEKGVKKMKDDELIYRLEKITSIANMTVDELNERQQTDRDELIKYLYPIKFGLMLGELRTLINELKKERD